MVHQNGPGVFEWRLQSRSRSASRSIMLFCRGWPHTRMVSLWFFPPSVCKACGEEFVDLTRLHNHNCQRRLNLLCRQLRLVGFWYGGACCLWTHSAPLFAIITSFSTMGLVIAVKSFTSIPHSFTVFVVLDMVARNTIHPTKIDIFDLTTHVS